MNNLEFGCKYKSLVVNFEGILMSRVSFITGCDRVALVDEKGEDKIFDVNLIRKIDNGIYEELNDTSIYNRYEDLDNALYDFGLLAKDKITEYEGRIVCKQISATGDIAYGLSPKYSPKSRDNEASWFDESRIEILEKKEIKEEEDKKEIKKPEGRVGGIANQANLKVR